MKTITIILIDLSGSMKNKMITAKRMLREELIPSIDFSDKIGINSFWSVNKKPYIKVEQAISITNKEQLNKTILQINNKNGGTPIASAIKHSVQSLKEYRAFNKRIVLVTDGQETDGGDYELEAQNARREGIECEIHIIGINLNHSALIKAKKISSISGGSISNIVISNASTYNPTTIRQSLSTFKKSFNSNINQITRTTEPIKAKVETKNIAKKASSNKTETKEATPETEKSLQSQVESNSKSLNILNKKIDNLTELVRTAKKESDEIIIEENEELNNHIGRVSEEFVYKNLQEKYRERVKWLNKEKESFDNHDFEIIDVDDTIEYFIECKGTNNMDKSFLLTKEEWILFLNNTKNYQLYFVNNALSKPEIIKIDNLLDWILKGKAVPYFLTNVKLKKERIAMTILE